MHRGLTFILIIITIFVTVTGKLSNSTSKASDQIPDEAIRLRIIANSNTSIDQDVKLEIKEQVINHIYPKIEGIDDKEEAEQVIYNEVESLNQVVNRVLKEHQIETNYYVDYGLTNFPTKVYGDKVYQAGKYEAVYIVLGEGKGDNWWCVLFPPLCLVDVNFNDNEVKENEKMEYSFYFIEKIKEFFN
jgi:stage II sporulation protein R